MVADHCQILFTVTVPCFHFCTSCIHSSVDVWHLQLPQSNLLAMAALCYSVLQSLEGVTACRSGFPPSVFSKAIVFGKLCFDFLSHGIVQLSRVTATVYRRQPGLPGRWTHHLEQPAGQRDIGPVSVNLPSAFTNTSVPVLIP